MTSTPSPHAPAGPATTSRRGLAVAAAGAAVLLGVAAVLVRVLPSHGEVCTNLADDARPPAAVTEAVGRFRDAVRDDVAVPDVVVLDVVCRLAAGVVVDDPVAADPRQDPASWVVGVDAQVAQVDEVVAAARGVLGAADDAPFAWDLRVRDAARSLEVVLAAGGGTGLVEDAVALRQVPGVAEVWFGPDSGRVAVAAGGDVVPLLHATAGRDLPVTTVEVRGPWVEVRQVHAGTWPDDDAVALALDVGGWDGVYRVLLTGGAPASTDLHADVEDDAHRAHVASRLDALVGPPVTYHVTSPAATVVGVVGGRGADGTGAADAADEAAAAEADGVPRCTGEELDVQVLGTDAAVGARYLFLRATHAGAAPCVVQGLPALAFTRASGTTTPDLTQLPDLVAPDAQPPVVLVPGGWVESQVRWAAMSTSQDPDVSVRVTVRAVAGGPTVDLALPGPLDVLAGATVRVGPWRTPDATG